MRKREEEAATPPEDHRLHLNMRPPSPATYRTPNISPAARFFIMVGAVCAFLILLTLPLVIFALAAGEPG